MKKLFTLLLFIGIIFAGIFAGSPYYTAYQLKQAYDNQDGVTIANAMNYPKLTTNIKSQLTSRFTNTLEEYPAIVKLGGSSLTNSGNKFIEYAVDGAITKDNIETIIRTQGQANTASKKLAAIWAIVSGKVNLSGLVGDMIAHRGNMKAVIESQIDIMIAQQSEELAESADSGTDSDEPVLKYCGINCFNISGQIKGYPITVQLEREALIEWKVVAVELP